MYYVEVFKDFHANLYNNNYSYLYSNFLGFFA